MLDEYIQLAIARTPTFKRSNTQTLRQGSGFRCGVDSSTRVPKVQDVDEDGRYEDEEDEEDEVRSVYVVK